MRCANCGSENPTDSAFCEQCGRKLEQLCPACKAPVSANARFCRKCGASLSATSMGSEAMAAGSSSQAGIRLLAEQAAGDVIDGERKTVTALFADIKGSMELMEDLDPEQARAIIDPALNLMMDAVRRFDGYVVQSTGDGIFALFGAPVAHEDHPQRALYSALRMHEAMRHYGERLRADKGLNLQVRIGINIGEVVVRTIRTGTEHAEYSPIGHSTSLAARLQTLATPGSTVITGNMRVLVEGYFQLKALGPTRIKGASELVELFEVIGLGPLRTRLQRAAGRGLTKFVGREREMEGLRHAAGMARERHGQLVAVMAEPGVGKSRLYYEFKARSQSGWMVLEAFSVSHGKASPYLPVIELLHGYFGIDPKDDGRKRREKVNGRIVTLDPALEDTRPYLFALLGLVEGEDPLAQMDADVKKRRTIDVIKRILLRESLNQPLMVIFEDLHWIDEQTQELLNLLAEAIGTTRILLLVNYRPEYHHLWGNKTYYTQLTLEPLGLESAQQMMDALLTSPAPATLRAGANRERARPERAASEARGEVEGSGSDIHVADRVRVQDGLAALKSLIIDRTEGNPFFIEEIVQGLFEQGLLVRNGNIKLTRPLSSVRIPATVQAMLSARIDRLAPEDKALLQTLAVLGKEFTLSQVRAVLAGSDSELDQRLAALQSAEFLYEQPTAGDIEYTFKHALTQEVAYNSILVERRKQLHERAGQAIESLFAASLSEHYDDLARHYSRSGNGLKAANYLQLAAQLAMDRGAYTEVGEQLKSALDLLGGQPESPERISIEIAVRHTLATSVGASHSAMSQVASLLQPARELCRRIGDDASLFDILWLLSFHHMVRAEHEVARALHSELLELTTRTRDAAMVGSVLTLRGMTLLREGKFMAADEDFKQVWRLPMDGSANRLGLYDWRVQSRLEKAFLLWISGYPERATPIIEEASAVARRINSPNDLWTVLWWSALLDLLRGNWQVAYLKSDELISQARQSGIPPHILFSDLIHSWSEAHVGQPEQALVEILSYRAGVFETPGILLCWLLIALVNVYIAAGRKAEALIATDEALQFIGLTGTRFIEAEMRRLRGELLLCTGDREAAAHNFEDAVEVARRQSAKSWELRATTSLARLLANQGCREEARRMLADLYNWFTEGFDTADLKEAKALLDELTV
jgi:class 3 adenylate cyclase/tetratricopeptide (TPR) repeat protein